MTIAIDFLHTFATAAVVLWLLFSQVIDPSSILGRRMSFSLFLYLVSDKTLLSISSQTLPIDFALFFALFFYEFPKRHFQKHKTQINKQTIYNQKQQTKPKQSKAKQSAKQAKSKQKASKKQNKK